MPINPDFLVSAAMLQDFIISKTGVPLDKGVITLYRDNDRLVLKNWYYQSGSPGNYNYIKLPNPMTLSAAGTMVDVNGADIIPFYYPRSEEDETVEEKYYITVDDKFGTRQFTRQDFPFDGAGSIPINGGDNLNNIIINNRFWRNIGSYDTTANPFTKEFILNNTTYSYITVSPSQHDGYILPDMVFMKGFNTGTDIITFEKFAQGETPLQDDITPEFYIRHQSGSQPGQTFKSYLIPISLHLKTLESQPATVTIQSLNNGSSSPGNIIKLSLLTFTGTGTASSTSEVIGTINTNAEWTKSIFPFIFSSTQNINIGNGGDDAFYLQIDLELNAQVDISFALPSIFLGSEVPTNDFENYDEINSIISSPRTGDFRFGMNEFYYFGWVPLNDGTIGNANSNATTLDNIDTWPLFNLLWQRFHDFTVGNVNLLAQMFDSAGVLVPYGGTAIADFNANNTISITKTLGQVLMGTVPIDAYLPFNFTSDFVVSNFSGDLLISPTGNVKLFNGMPFYVTNDGGTLPGGLLPNTIYYVAALNINEFFVAISFTNAISNIVLPFVSSGSGTHTFFAALAGTKTGEYDHRQLVNELAMHSHPTFTPGGTFVNEITGGGFVVGTATSFTHHIERPATTGNTGNSDKFNVVQPSTFINMYMKL